MSEFRSPLNEYIEQLAALEAEHTYVSARTRRRIRHIVTRMPAERGERVDDAELASALFRHLEREELLEIVADWIRRHQVF